MSRIHSPVSSYRLQFGAHFSFADAQRVVPYLESLGISDCYVSPLLKATAGSEHGYDICDHNALNQELGSDQDFDALAATLCERQMGLILDFVPNHMGLDPAANPWWHDVLQHGQASPYAGYFDIDWDPITPELKGRILLPILEDGYGDVLDRGELRLGFETGEFHVQYFDHRLPVEPRSSLSVLRSGLADLNQDGAPARSDWLEYLDILKLLEHLPPLSTRDPEEQAKRQRISSDARQRLDALAEASPTVHMLIEHAVTSVNGTPGQPSTFDRLHDLLEQQPYRVAHWKTAFDEINYRRFFDINDLGAIRMEDPRVFNAAHRKVLQLIADGKVTGLRIDHPDGLFDPASYFKRLQYAIAEAQSPTDASSPRPFYIVAEKILSHGEFLPDGWPIAGTTGYGFLNAVNGLFIDGANEDLFRNAYVRLTGRRESFADIAHDSQRLVMGSSMASELGVLAQALKAIAVSDRRTRDFTLRALSKTIVEVVACLPCYRTYVNEAGFSATDRETIDLAVDRARCRNPVMAQSLFLFLRNVLLAEADPANGDVEARRHFAMKFQQFSAPIQAKGLEDTSFYRYNLLLSLNEVGGDPGRFGTSIEEFHGGNRVRLERYPLEMITTATHDTKRGEDARARLNVLSEIPALWRRSVSEWRKINASHRTAVDRESAPDANDEYLFYQTLVSSWPAEPVDAPIPAEASPELVARLRTYMQKAIKEAKTHTSWFNQGGAYEDAVSRFVETTLRGSAAKRFLKTFIPFMRRVAIGGMVNSLSQLVLKGASPGVPDFYQGAECWRVDMADPDNRRPVDFADRETALRELLPWIERSESGDSRSNAVCGCDAELESYVRTLLAAWPDARIKLFVMACALRLRRKEPTLLLEGSYEPLRAAGAEASHLVAIARSKDAKTLIAVTPRLMNQNLPTAFALPTGPDVWKDTRLIVPAHLSTAVFRNVLTGARLTPAEDGSLPVADLLRTAPVALLWGSK
jgi:(1->4)-alpha-D-glucan 1-alpha-D-glucosylmutase